MSEPVDPFRIETDIMTALPIPIRACGLRRVLVQGRAMFTRATEKPQPKRV